MTSKRERDDNGHASEDGRFDLDPKRQRLNDQSFTSSSSPPRASENTLLPGFNYGDEDEEEDNRRRPPLNDYRVDDGDAKRAGQNGDQEEDEYEDDYYRDQDLNQGKRSREIEVRRDCPYLDTVNRQVCCCT